MKAHIMSRILIKYSGGSTIREITNPEDLYKLGVELHKDFDNYLIEVGKKIALDDKILKIIDIKCVLDKNRLVSNEYPFNFDVLWFVE